MTPRASLKDTPDRPAIFGARPARFMHTNACQPERIQGRRRDDFGRRCLLRGHALNDHDDPRERRRHHRHAPRCRGPLGPPSRPPARPRKVMSFGHCGSQARVSRGVDVCGCGPTRRGNRGKERALRSMSARSFVLFPMRHHLGSFPSKTTDSNPPPRPLPPKPAPGDPHPPVAVKIAQWHPPGPSFDQNRRVFVFQRAARALRSRPHRDAVALSSHPSRRWHTPSCESRDGAIDVRRKPPQSVSPEHRTADASLPRNHGLAGGPLGRRGSSQRRPD